MVREYTEDDIKTLPTKEHIRLRSAMYLGELGPNMLHRLCRELIQNSIDEFTVGRASWLRLEINTKENSITVVDNGNGIPHGKLVEIFKNANTGGKYNNEAYAFSSGQNGIGLKAVNAFSHKLEVKSRFKAKLEGENDSDKYSDYTEMSVNFLDFEEELDSIIYQRVSKIDPWQRGTSIKSYANMEAIQVNSFDHTRLYNELRDAAFPYRGLTIDFIVDKNLRTIYVDPETKIIDYHNDYLTHKKFTPMFLLTSSNALKDGNVSFEYELSFGYSKKVESGTKGAVKTYVNNIETPSHGTHLEGLRTGISKALTFLMKSEPNIIPSKYSKLNVTGGDLSEHLVALLYVRHSSPAYDNQTKDRLCSEDIKNFINSAIYNEFKEFLLKNRNVLTALVLFACEKAKMREDLRKTKDKIMEKQSNIKITQSISAIKYSPATLCDKEPEKCELIITEGNSASEGLQSGRNPLYQAIYSLKGKPINAIAAGASPSLIVGKEANTEFRDLLMILGCDYGDNFNMDNLRYHTIIIASDADNDGFHIRTLILSFFYAYMPELIVSGKVFIASPPILAIHFGKHQLDLVNIKEELIFKRNLFPKLFHMCHKTSKGNKVLPDRVFEYYIEKFFGYVLFEDGKVRLKKLNYCDFMDYHAKNIGIDPDLLEMIIINLNDLIKGNIPKIFAEYNIHVYVDPNNKQYYHFDYGDVHNALYLDDDFYNRFFNPIIERLKSFSVKENDLVFFRPSLYVKKEESFVKMYPTFYSISKFLDGVLEKSKNFKIDRFKGLGEMGLFHVHKVLLHKETRKLTKIVMDENIKEDEANIIEVMMGKKHIDEKRTIFDSMY